MMEPQPGDIIRIHDYPEITNNFGGRVRLLGKVISVDDGIVSLWTERDECGHHPEWGNQRDLPVAYIIDDKKLTAAEEDQAKRREAARYRKAKSRGKQVVRETPNDPEQEEPCPSGHSIESIRRTDTGRRYCQECNTLSISRLRMERKLAQKGVKVPVVMHLEAEDEGSIAVGV